MSTHTHSLTRVLVLSLAILIVISRFLVPHLSQAQGGPTVISGKFYRFDVVAAGGQGGLTDVQQSPSINDNGVVAFVPPGELIASTLGALSRA